MISGVFERMKQPAGTDFLYKRTDNKDLFPGISDVRCKAWAGFCFVGSFGHRDNSVKVQFCGELS